MKCRCVNEHPSQCEPPSMPAGFDSKQELRCIDTELYHKATQLFVKFRACAMKAVVICTDADNSFKD